MRLNASQRLGILVLVTFLAWHLYLIISSQGWWLINSLLKKIPTSGSAQMEARLKAERAKLVQQKFAADMFFQSLKFESFDGYHHWVTRSMSRLSDNIKVLTICSGDRTQAATRTRETLPIRTRETLQSRHIRPERTSLRLSKSLKQLNIEQMGLQVS